MHLHLECSSGSVVVRKAWSRRCFCVITEAVVANLTHRTTQMVNLTMFSTADVMDYLLLMSVISFSCNAGALK